MKHLPIFILLTLLTSCLQEQEFPLDRPYPAVITLDPESLNNTGVTIRGQVIRGTSEAPLQYGFELKRNSSSESVILEGAGEIVEGGTASLRIESDLQAGVDYSYRFFVSWQRRKYYGEYQQFKALGSQDPSINSLSQSSGYDGDEILINGEFFSNIPSRNKVFINNIEAEVLESSSSQIRFILPQMAFFGETEIVVRVGDSKEAKADFIIIGPNVSNITPLPSRIASVVTIKGNNFTPNGNQELLQATLSINDQYQEQVELLSLSNEEFSFILPYSFEFRPGDDVAMDLDISVGPKKLSLAAAIQIESSWSTTADIFLKDLYWHRFSYDDEIYYLELDDDTFFGYTRTPSIYKLNQSNHTLELFSEANTYISDEGRHVVAGNTLYRVIGNREYNSENHETWAFDMQTRRWVQKASLPFNYPNNYTASFFSIGNQLYLVTDVGNVWQYDPVQNRWIQKSNTPTNSTGLDIFEFNGSIYFHDLYENSKNQVWRYNQASDTWTAVTGFGVDSPSFPQSNYGGSNKLFSLKGEIYKKNGIYLFRYYPNNNSWHRVMEFICEDPIITQSEAYFRCESNQYNYEYWNIFEGI